MENTSSSNELVAIFSDREAAEHARQELIQSGLRRDQVEVTSAADVSYNAASGNAGLSSRQHDSSGGGLALFHRLFGDDSSEEDRAYYQEATRDGRYAVVVDAPDDVIDRASEILNSNGAMNIETGAHTATTTQRVSDKSNAVRGTGEQTNIPVVQEELNIGKRAVNRGGVRVYSKVSEQPVEQNVSLREERVRVERRPVDRPATDADLQAANMGVIEVIETVEEPVIEKRSRVVEEVHVGKEVTERQQPVRDTVHRSDVKVEDTRTGATGSRTNTYDDDFRNDFRTRYGNTGRYEDYAPAYEYGYQMASDPRYQGRDFSDVEQDLQADYTRRYPNSTWQRIKDSVRYGWEKVTGQR